MKTIHRIIGVLLYLTGLGLAGYVVYALGIKLFYPECALWQQSLAWISVRSILVFEVAAGLTMLLLLYLLTGLPRKSRRKSLVFKSDGGTVSVSVQAVSDFIAKMDSEFAALLYLHPEVEPSGSSVRITLDIKVRSGTNIPELCRLLQQRVRDGVRDNLGIEDIRKIKVNVKDIVPQPGKQPVQDVDDVDEELV